MNVPTDERNMIGKSASCDSGVMRYCGMGNENETNYGTIVPGTTTSTTSGHMFPCSTFKRYDIGCADQRIPIDSLWKTNHVHNNKMNDAVVVVDNSFHEVDGTILCGDHRTKCLSTATTIQEKKSTDSTHSTSRVRWMDTSTTSSADSQEVVCCIVSGVANESPKNRNIRNSLGSSLRKSTYETSTNIPMNYTDNVELDHNNSYYDKITTCDVGGGGGGTSTTSTTVIQPLRSKITKCALKQQMKRMEEKINHAAKLELYHLNKSKELREKRTRMMSIYDKMNRKLMQKLPPSLQVEKGIVPTSSSSSSSSMDVQSKSHNNDNHNKNNNIVNKYGVTFPPLYKEKSSLLSNDTNTLRNQSSKASAL